MAGERTQGAAWYGAGLRFRCTRCGNCCTGASGTVRVSDVEIEQLAASLAMTGSEFRSVHTRTLRGGDVSLRERRDGACVFYDPHAGCRVYPWRPRQCRTWPFWRSVVHSRERWEEEARHCPGMNRGPLHPARWIALRLADDGTRGAGAPDGADPPQPPPRQRR